MIEPAKSTILIVDDNPTNLRLLAQMLSQRGYKTRVANDGALALESVLSNPPDLILLDIMMPKMDGYAVCEYLKTQEATRQIPVIFISALSETFDKVRAFRVGGVDYVTKPFQVEEVLVRVETHLAMYRLQRQLQAANRALDQQVQELNSFAHTLAHDLKNPLSVIMGFSDMLAVELDDLDYPEAPRLRQHSLTIFRNSLKMQQISDSLLLLARARQETVEFSRLDMGAIVQQACQQLDELIRHSQAEVIIPAGWPVALGYEPWVEAIWVNYLSNALKYGGSPETGRPPRLELGFDPAGAAGGLVRFWVRDNGPGLSPEEQARLFLPFSRIHQDRASGHGLGLSIVQRIAERLGGQVAVSSQPGRGSEFSFSLPGA